MSYYSEGAGTRLRRFLTGTFGFRGASNVTSWLVAGGIAYYFIYLPDQRRAREILAAREAAKKAAIEKGSMQDVDRVRPIHQQDVGLIQGIKAVRQQQQQQQQRQQQQQGEQQPAAQQQQQQPPPSQQQEQQPS